MLYATAMQLVRRTDEGGVGKDVKTVQVITVPAAELRFTRKISDSHPRSQWRRANWAGEGLRIFSGTGTDIRTDWRSHAAPDEVHWAPTHDFPLLFEITDSEYLEMTEGIMPRNSALRFQRALEGVGANIHGKAARTPEHVVLAVSEDFHSGTGFWARVENTNPTGWGGFGPWGGSRSMASRMRIMTNAVREHIAAGDQDWLNIFVPKGAEARGAERHRNGYDLPRKGETVDASAPAPAPAPAPEVVAAPSAAAGVIKAGERIARPNGEHYVARSLSVGIKDLSDVQLFVDELSAGGSIALRGEPGTGKTASLEAAAAAMGKKLVTYVATPDTEAADLVGQYVAIVGSDGREVLSWRDGPLVQAMIDGDIFLLDELGLVPANELSPLYPLMDGRGAIEEIPMNPGRGRVEAAPGFAIVGAWNPNSSKHIAEALLSRFTLIADHTTDYRLARTMDVPERAVAFAEHLEMQREAGDVVWAPQFRELLAFKRDEDKRGTLYALQNLLSNAPALERDVIAAMAMERWGDVAGARKNVRAMRI